MLSVLLLCNSPAFAAFIIDDFSTIDSSAIFSGADGSYTYNAGTTSEFTMYEKNISSDSWTLYYFEEPAIKTVDESGLNTWGGTRFTEIDFTNSFGISNDISIYTSYSGGVAISDQGSGSWKTFSMTYAGGGSDFTNATKLSVTFEPDHVGFGKSTYLLITLQDSDSEDTYTVEWDTCDDTLGETTVDFLFADYVGIDKEDIQAIILSYESDLANDVIFSSIMADAGPTPGASPVPIPGADWLLGTGLLAFTEIRRRFMQ